MHDSALKQALGYRRFTGAPRILMFDSGYFVTRDVFEAGAELGHQMTSLPVRSKGKGDPDFIAKLLGALCTHQPDFVLTINHLGFDEQGILAGLLERYEVPVCSWFVDHPLGSLGGTCGRVGGNARPNCQVFCIESTALPWLREHGFVDPLHLPTAAGRAYDALLVDPGRAAALGAPLCFVGDSWWRKAWDEPSAWLQAAAEQFRRRHLIDKALVARGLEAILRELELDGAAEHGVGLLTPYAVAGVALAQEACVQRVALAQALQQLGLRIYGDAQWARLVPGVELRPQLDPLGEAPAAFAGSGVNINVTAVQMPTAVNLRVWEVPAAGGFLLTDEQEDALRFFRPGEELATYAGVEEVAERARFYLERPALRRQIAARARARVETEHRYPHRLRRIVEVMRARFG